MSRVVFVLTSAVSLVLTVGLLSACGGDESTAGSGGATSDASVEEACSIADAAMKAPTFQDPGPPVDAAVAQGKSMFYIPFIAGSESAQITSKAVEEAAGIAGMNFTLFDGKASVTQFTRGVSQAVAEDADVIVLLAIPPDAVAEELREARKKGIVVIDSNNGDPDDPLGLVDGHATASYSQAGKIRAAHAVCETNGDVNGLVFTTNELTTSPVMMGSLVEELRRLCPECESKELNVPVAEFDRVPAIVKTELQSNPDINYVFPTYGDVAFGAYPAMQEIGAFDRGVKLDAFNAVEANLEQVKAGTISSDLGNSLRWLGWGMVDQSLRLLSDEKPVDERIPLRLFTQENLQDVQDLGDDAALYGAGYQDGYRRLWGLR